MTVEEGRQQLRSWKEIAAHFDISVRTAQRWEKEGGLPVHREAGGRPIAYVEELNRWQTERAHPSVSRQRKKPGLLIGAGLAWMVVLVLAWWLWPRGGELTSVTLGADGRSILALDESGQTLWRFELPDYLTQARYAWTGPLDMDLVEDIDGDGRKEVLFNYRTAAGPPEPGILYCFEQDGRLRWQRSLGRATSFRGREFDDDYSGHFIRLVRGPRRRYLLTVALHRYWYPCQVALRDPETGDLLEEYWHPGGLSHILLHDLDGDGVDEVILAGINNPGDGLGHASLVVLKVPFSEVSPKDDSPFAEFTGGREFRYLLFPRPDITFLNGTLILIDRLRLEGRDRFLVRLRLSAGGEGHLFYFLDRDLNVVEFRISDDVISMHDRLYLQGLLNHAWSNREKACLSHPAILETAPDGNNPAVGALWDNCEFSLGDR